MTRAATAVNFVITQNDLYSVGCGKGCRCALGSVRDRDREGVCVTEGERATEGELNKTPTHLHSVQFSTWLRWQVVLSDAR